ncbi:AVRPPHE avirulence protein [Ralstonia pseudosolanacearum]|uniref:AVRPPHE avirulence protein n=1 Tax=Ralstonia pseudosolanacearum TaxID=1310165 RepID=UPI000DAEFCAB|nr:AVRPPHE avirulence protein [Ralstonia pseudosolanacearum]AZU57636.1 AVRPPHE avirulence protein [Ralstonia solanacearum]MCK4136165.1 AVRPPHE avirulence protein [Ralstonia pseudosolanacearum]MCK4152806.1 AVRPPHE avirulence protein [Ralstonia pseudosolanacearum]RAA09091.1 AVRPPHE avirulence protein [Ralstonia pseudosolanacearum]UQY82649.1 AVRPPHE avirulence protein [Ralstonia pseudosolanacearum]
MPPVLPSILRCFRPAVSRPEAETAAPSSSQEHDRPGSPERSPRRAPAALQGLTPRAGSSRRQAAPDAPAGPARFLTDGERQFGGYLMARDVDQRPVHGEPLDTLRSANETLLQTRRILTHGRGNVEDDIDATHGLSTHIAQGGRSIQESMWRAHPKPVVWAAIAMVAGAGNCGEHADLATFLHAAKLKEGEAVDNVHIDDFDHFWAIVHRAEPDLERDVYIDPWGKGPAIFAVDGMMTYRPGERRTKFGYDKASGEEAHADMEMLATVLATRMRGGISNTMHRLGPDYRYPPERVWAVTPIVAQRFTDRVKAEMSKPADLGKLAVPPDCAPPSSVEPPVTNERLMQPLRHEIHATRIARTLGAHSVDTMAHAARRIVAVASDLQGYPIEAHPLQAKKDAEDIAAAERRRARRAALGKGEPPATES